MTFKTIPSLNHLYEINEDGTVIRNALTKHIMAQEMASSGYLQFKFTNKQRKSVHRYIHRLVAECFIGPCPAGLVVDHIDHNKTNNHFSNLRYTTVYHNSTRGFHGEAKPTSLYKIFGGVYKEFHFPSRWLAAKFIADDPGCPVCARTIKCNYFNKKKIRELFGYHVFYGE